MEDFFELKWQGKDEIGTLYSLDLKGDNVSINFIKKSIETNQLKTNDEIQIEIDPRTGTGKKRLGDIVHWQKGLPNAHLVIVSEDVLDNLLTLTSPIHKIYNLNIINSTKDFKKYFAFHIIGNVFENINFNQQIFYKKNVMNDSNEGFLEKGSIHNYNEFINIRSELVKNNSQTLGFDEIVYSHKYDLLPGFPTSVLINEDAKKNIEKKFLLNYKEFKKYTIRFIN